MFYAEYNQGDVIYLKCSECGERTELKFGDVSTYSKEGYEYECLECGYMDLIGEVVDMPCNDRGGRRYNDEDHEVKTYLSDEDMRYFRDAMRNVNVSHISDALHLCINDFIRKNTIW